MGELAELQLLQPEPVLELIRGERGLVQGGNSPLVVGLATGYTERFGDGHGGAAQGGVEVERVWLLD